MEGSERPHRSMRGGERGVEKDKARAKDKRETHTHKEMEKKTS